MPPPANEIRRGALARILGRTIVPDQPLHPLRTDVRRPRVRKTRHRMRWLTRFTEARRGFTSLGSLVMAVTSAK